MSYLTNDITAPLIQIDSVAIGFQLDSESEARNINSLDLNKDEFLAVGEKTYIPGDTSNTKWSLFVNSKGTSVNASRNLARDSLTHDTSLYVDKNIHCSGIIKAAGLELNNLRIDSDNPITSNLIRDFIVKTNDLVVSQPFQTGYITNYSNLYNINYDVKNVFTPNFVTFGGHIDTFKNTHPLNIVTTPNNKFSSMHISIRNDTNNDEEPSRMCIGMIGGSNISPAIISTTRGVPLEFHISTYSENINAAYGTKAFPIYNSNNVPAMTIDAYNNVGIGTNYTSIKNYYKKIFINNSTTNVERFGKSKLEVQGLSTFDDILVHDYQTNTYKHLDDIYIRSTGIGVLNATQIKGGDFTDTESLYTFKNDLTVSKTLNTSNANIYNNATIGSNLTTEYLKVNEHSTFDGTVGFNNDVNFDNVQNININNLNINNDLFINNRRITALNTTDTFTGNFDSTTVDGSNYIFIYVSSNIASLDANCNVNFPNKLGIGLTDTDGFDGVLNIIKNDRTTSNNFDILLKNTLENNNYIANIGRLSRLDYNDNSLIFNTNKVPGKNNNIYFYPSSDISELTSNSYLPNLKNTPPTLSLLNGKVGINKLNPDNLFALDIVGRIAASDYYVSQDNNFKRTKNFIYNNGKNFFNLYDSSTDKFCINYNELISFASDMRGLNVKKGINADLYYQNNILLETLQKASSADSFYTNKNISIGWNGEANIAPLQVRNLYTKDYNYSTIRIYRGVRGGGLFNNADYSGIDICEYDRDINQDRNKEKWFIYKNHKYNDLDARDYMRIGPLQIGYTDKTIEPTSYGMSFYYDPATSNYHIDVNNPKVSYEDKSAMTIYGDLNVHGNINILDNEGCNFNFTMKALSSNLQRVDRYINYISGNDIDNGYSASANKIAMSIDILRPKENVIIDPIENKNIPVIIKNMNDDNPATKFITYSKSNVCYSMIELAIYNSNLQLFDDEVDKQNNIRNAIQISVGNNNSNTYFDFNVYNNDSYKNFMRFINTVSDNGDANSTIAHLGLGTDKSSNILLHIDGNEKYGLQITNNKYPASINLLNSEGKNVYHNISGGDFHNNHKFTIDVASANVDVLNNEPTMTNVFTIDAFNYNGEKRRGARYGFNEDFTSNFNQTFVIKSDYDTVPMSITSRYSYEYMFNSTVKIDFDNVSINLLSSNWNNTEKEYFSFYKQDISALPEIDANNNVITSNNLEDDDFIFKTNNLISTDITYITIHSNINYPYFFSNLDIDYMPLNNQTFTIYNDGVQDKYDLSKEHDFSLVPQGVFYSSNDDIKPSDIAEKMLLVNNNAVFKIYDSNILFNYEYINRYNISEHITCNIFVSVSSNIAIIDNSNYFNISNYITTTLGTVSQPFNELEYFTQHIYTDFNQNAINLNEKFLEYSNIFLNTYTTNILKYNSNISYDAVFYAVHTNRLNIATSNIIFEELFEQSTAYLSITSNIQDNNIIFRTSNYSINNNANATQRNMVIQQFSSNVFQDTFDILGNTINNTLIIEEYINNYCNFNLEDINIGIRNYNFKNYKPHISLINDVEKNNSIFEGHEIYSYDGIFEIKYANSTNAQFVPLKIDNVGNMFINGSLDMRGDLRFDGHIYDANGNDLIEILNKNYYREYEINSSNIHFNSLGSNGLEINSYAGCNYIDYKFFYVKDYLSTNVINDILVLHKSELTNNTYNLDLYADLYVNCNLYIEGEGNNPSLSVFQKHNNNIIQAANLDREVLTVAFDGSIGFGVTEPQGVLLNARQNNMGSNIISASNIDREVLTVAYDGSIGFGVTEPRGILLNARQNNIGSNIISASNIEREVLTVAYDGSIGFGVTQPQGVLLNARQNNIGSNIISASNINREVLTVAYDGSIGFGVTEPQGVLLNARQNNLGSNIISASNIDREVLTVAYDGSIGFGVAQPQGVLLNARQNNMGSNIISASNIEREVLTVAYDGSIGFGVTEPQGVLLNARQNNMGSNIISASNIDREVLTVAYDGSIGFGVTQPQGVLLNARQNNLGSNIISASNINREVLTVAYDGSIGFGVTQPQGVLLNARQNNMGSNIISASNIEREVLTVAYDGSIGFGVTQPQGVLLNARQNNMGSNIISASNIEREVLTVAYDGSIGFGVTQPQGVLLNARQNNLGSNIISASNIDREVLTVAYDGSIGFGVTQPQGVLLNARQNNIGSNIISASNIEREVLTVAYDGSIGFGVTEPRGILLNARQNNLGSNIISASNINREVLTVAYDGSIGFGVTQPQGVLLNARQNNIGSNIISASNINREVLTVAYDGSIGFGVTQPQGVLLNARQNNIGSNIISASNINREVLTVAYDGSIGFGVTEPQGVLLNARQNNLGSNIISASNIEREVLTVAYDGSIGFGVTQPRGILLNARQNNIGSNIISASNIDREVLTVAYDGSIGFGVTQPQGVLLNARQNNIGSNIISASNIEREVLTVAYDGSIGFGVTEPRGILLNARQNNIGSNIISASNIDREVLTVAYDGSIGFGVTQPQGVLLNARQNNLGSNIISASNINREVLTVAYDGSIGFGVTQPQGVLLNARQNNLGSNIISASNINREVLTVAYDGSIGFGVTQPQGVLLNARQNNLGSNIISASNIEREVLTVAYDGSIGFGVTQPQGVLLNARQNNLGSNIISASNIEREVLTVAYDGSIGFGVTETRGILLNARQNNLGSNIISASNIDREVLTVAYDGSIGFGVTQPQGVLLNARQNNLGSNIISASNIDREVLTVAYDGSIGFGVTETRGILLNARQNNIGSNIISASNLNNEVMTLTYDGIMGLGVTNPNKQSILDVRGNINIVSEQGTDFIYTINNRDIMKETCNYIVETSNVISLRITNLTTDLITENITSINKFIVDNKYNNNLFIDGDLTINSNLIVHGVTTTLNTDVYTTEQLNITNTGEGDALIVKQINNSYNIFTASNNNIPVFNINYNGRVGIGTENPKVFLEINSTDGIKIPSGTDIQRPSGNDLVQGTIRYNTDTNQFEGYGAGNNWGTLGGVKDVNNDTFISAESAPGVNNDELRFITSNFEKMIIKKDGRVGIGTENPKVFLEINSTDGIKIPSGTDIQRPSGNDLVQGTIRYNTDTNQFEGYGAGNNWGTLGGVKDVNNDTFISAESAPGVNNDELRFITSNFEKMIIKKDGRVGIGTENPKVFLEINSTDGIKIPSGTDIQRPSGNDLVQGTIRYNTDTNQFEGYGAGNNWGTLGGVKDVNNDTFISAESAPGVNNDELRFITSNFEKMIIKKDGRVGIGTENPKVFLEINSTDGIKIPSGTDIQRPSGNDLVQGTIRYNTDTNQFEGYGAGNNWGTLGGVKDVNNDTYISAESAPGVNNDELRFITSNFEKMIIKKDGRVGIGKENPEYLLDVQGDIRTNSNLFVNFNVGIGTTNISSSLLNIYGKDANIKIQNPQENNPVSSIEFINGLNNSIQNNTLFGWRISNSNNNFSISSGKNNVINDRLIIDGGTGNIGIGTKPHIEIDNNGDTYKINVNGSINIEGDIYKQGVLFSQGSGGTGGSVGVIAQNMPVQTLSKTYANTKSYLESGLDNDGGWKFIDENINGGFLIKIKPSHRTSKILINLTAHIGIDSSPESIWWGLRLYRKLTDNNNNVITDWHEVVASRPENNSDNATPCWLSHTLGANLTSYENFVANINGTFFDTPDSRYNVYYTVKWKTNMGNNYSGGANIYLNRPAKYNSSNSSVLSSTWTVTEIWQLGTPYIPSEGSNIITIYNQDYVGIGNTQPQNSLDVTGDINITGVYKINNEIFKTSQWTTNTDNNIYYNNFIGVGTSKPDCLLSLSGDNAKLKIHDDGINNEGNARENLSTSIDLINGTSNAIQYNLNKCGWRMSNSNNDYIISSGSNSIITDRFIIDGATGNIGIGTSPNHKLDIDGIVNATAFNLNGSPFVLEFTQGMTIQTIHKNYSKTVEKELNSIGWIPIDIQNDGFYVKIKPSHIQSKVLVSMTCHIGMDYAEDSRWWGLQLYRKIGSGSWMPINDANGTNSGGLECTPCWISHNLGADNSMYSHSIINVSGSYEDMPNTEEDVYYTAYWKSKLDNTIGKLYINRPAYVNNSNYPLTSSSWTASEIWNNGTPYKPITTTIAIAYDKVGIGMTPSESSEYKLEVAGNVRCSNLQCVSVNQTSDMRYKKNIENIGDVLENINKLNPVSYLLLNQESADKKSFGFIAQELNEIFPEVVVEPNNEHELYGINYTSIIPLLTKSIQELTKKIELQQNEINYLKQKL
jgi:hypothetical protein